MNNHSKYFSELKTYSVDFGLYSIDHILKTDAFKFIVIANFIDMTHFFFHKIQKLLFLVHQREMKIINKLFLIIFLIVVTNAKEMTFIFLAF